MKLLFCQKCQSVINLALEEKLCPCGNARGRYLDTNRAEYSGDDVIPFAIDNYSFFTRIKQDKEKQESAHSQLYDSFYGKNKIQCWLLTDGNTNSELITKVEQPKPKPVKRSLRACG